jgi:hypothetical protein
MPNAEIEEAFTGKQQQYKGEQDQGRLQEDNKRTDCCSIFGPNKPAETTGTFDTHRMTREEKSPHILQVHAILLKQNKQGHRTEQSGLCPEDYNLIKIVGECTFGHRSKKVRFDLRPVQEEIGFNYLYASAAEGNCCSVGYVEIIPGRFRRLIGNRLG